MARDTEIDRLVVRILADTSQLKTEFTNIGKHIDTNTTAWEKSVDKFSSGIQRAGKELLSLRNIAGALGVGFGASALIDFTAGLVKNATELENQSKVLGISVEALQAYHAAAIESGAAADVGDEAIRRFTRSIGEARGGSAALSDAFAELHITGEDLAGGTEASLPKTAAALLQIEDATIRARLETVLFGRSGQEVEQVLLKWADPEIIQNMKNLGLVIDAELVQRAAEADRKWSLLWMKMKVGLSGALFNNPMGADMTPSERDRFFGPGPVKITPINPGLVSVPGDVNVTSSPLAAGLEAIDAQHKFDSDVKKSQEEFLRTWKMTGLTAVDDWEKDNGLRLSAMTKASFEINAAREHEGEVARMNSELEIHYTQLVERASDQSYRESVQGADQLRSVLMEVGTAANHGFGAFKEAAARALQYVSDLIIQMLVLKPLVESIAGPSGTSLGGIAGTILSAIAGGGGTGVNGFDITDVPGRAGGGRVFPGQPYLVGEKRPEIFMPDSPGSIRAAGGGGTGGGELMVTILPSPLFDARVDQRLAGAAPVLVRASVDATRARLRNTNGRP